MGEKDKKITDALQKNARLSYQELGEMTGMSRVAAKKRVTRLEKEGVIRGYNTCIYREGEVRAFIDVETVPERFDAMLRYVSTRMEWVRQIYCLCKPNHFMMVVVPPSSEDLRYMANVIARQDGVVHVTCNAVSEVIKEGVIHCEHGWWYPEQEGAEPNLFGVWKSNVNLLLPHFCVHPLGFGSIYKEMMCKIYKAQGLDG